VLEAGAGTGKTTLAKLVVDSAKKSGLSIVGLAPSWVAADELARSTGIEASAIARFRHELAAGRRQPPDANTLVIAARVRKIQGCRRRGQLCKSGFSAKRVDISGTSGSGR
jgi:ATP-dependent exoDNAse (exonuclease V) alpha subunit